MSETPQEAIARREGIRTEMVDLYKQIGLLDATTGRGRLTGLDYVAYLTDELIDDYQMKMHEKPIVT